MGNVLLLFLLPYLAAGDPAPLYLKPESTVLIEGLKVHYRIRGKGDPIVLIHGFCGSTFSWRYQLEELSGKFKLYALDLKGFGFSGKPARGEYSAPAQARLVAQFMERLKIKKAHIAGHSMGGLVAQELANLHPEKVDRLILVSSVAGGKKRAAPRKSRLPKWGMWLLKKTASGLVRMPILGKIAVETLAKHSLKRVVFDEKIVIPEVVQGYVGPLLDPSFVEALFSMGEGALQGTSSPQNIAHPTLLLWGREDKVVPLQVGRKLKMEIPGASLVVFPKTGHLPAEEVPEKFNKALLRFLKEGK